MLAKDLGKKSNGEEILYIRHKVRTEIFCIREATGESQSGTKATREQGVPLSSLQRTGSRFPSNCSS